MPFLCLHAEDPKCTHPTLLCPRSSDLYLVYLPTPVETCNSRSPLLRLPVAHARNFRVTLGSFRTLTCYHQLLRKIGLLFLGRELILRIRPLSLLPLPPQSGYLLPRLLQQPLPWSLSCCCHATCYGECALHTATRERFQKK